MAFREPFHSLPRYAPTTRSLRAMSWLVLLMAAGLIVNLALYFFTFLATLTGSSISDADLLLWTVIAGVFVACSLLPAAVLIARVDATHNEAKQEIASRQRKGVLSLLRLDVEVVVPAMLRRGEWIVAIMLIGLAMELVGTAYLIVRFERNIVDHLIGWLKALLTVGVIVEGLVLATGAAGLLVQVVLERLPRRRHGILLRINRPLIVYGAWFAAPLMSLSMLICVPLIYTCWLWMAAITLSSVVTCIFAHLTLRRAIRQTT